MFVLSVCLFSHHVPEIRIQHIPRLLNQKVNSLFLKFFSEGYTYIYFEYPTFEYLFPSISVRLIIFIILKTFIFNEFVYYFMNFDVE